MLFRYPHAVYPAAALAAAVLFGAGEIIGPWSAGITNFNSPLGVPALLFAGVDPAGAGITRAALAPALHVFLAAKALLVAVFVTLLALQLSARTRRWPGRDGMFIVGQLAAGLAIDSVALHLIVAAQLAACLPRRRALGWLGVQIGLTVAIDLGLVALLRPDPGRLVQLLINISLERGVLALGFGIALLVRSERRASLALAAAHAELLGTQALLADTVRSSERLRIARDLHDAVGHHLTALNLHLELATRQLDGAAAPSLRTSRELAHDLLAEVRAMVGTERREQPIDLPAALRSLCAGIPTPRIALRVDPAFRTDSPAVAHTVFCCVQEAITNALRHAGAGRLTIELARRDGEILLDIADDGRGSGGRPEGHGLRGMRERLLAHGGQLAAGDRTGGGFALAVRMPHAGAAP